ncbi:MAG: outer membrane beta-barrel protein [Cyclobacteriaceae bacterium]
MKKILLSSLFLTVVSHLWSQQFVAPSATLKPSAFDKKLRWGISLTQSWSTITGNSSSYFSKPSVGILASVEYFPLDFLGVSAGIGYQQRGTGIKSNYTGPVDSTYRERLRFNTFEVPISVIIRTPKDIMKGLRLSGSIGIVPIINRNSRDSKISVEPNIADLDETKDVSSSYFKNDVAFQFMAGPEIDMASSQIIKIQFYYSQGTTNVFSAGQGTGHNQNIGLRLSWMF